MFEEASARLASLVARDSVEWRLRDETAVQRATALVNDILADAGALDEHQQSELIAICSQNFDVTMLFLRGDLRRIPMFLRNALISTVLYGGGVVEAPEDMKDRLERVLEDCGTYWCEIPTLFEASLDTGAEVLMNPTIDPEILADEFEWPGDSRNLLAILANPICPAEFHRRILNGDHPIFDDLAEGIVDDERVREIQEFAQARMDTAHPGGGAA